MLTSQASHFAGQLGLQCEMCIPDVGVLLWSDRVGTYGLGITLQGWQACGGEQCAE